MWVIAMVKLMLHATQNAELSRTEYRLPKKESYYMCDR
jgi:hypothetical protein